MLYLIKIIAVIFGAALLIAGFMLQTYAACCEVAGKSKPLMWRFFGNLLEIIGIFGTVYVLLCV